MERILTTPRSDWQAQVEALGFDYHSMNQAIYWDERACYHFKAREIEQLESATQEIEGLCLELVEHVVEQCRYAELGIPEYAWPLIEASWRNREKPLLGRLDFSYNGTQPPKLLEYNADVALGLLESSLIQKQWLEQVYSNRQQFNTIHEKLMAARGHWDFQQVHLTCRTQREEVFGNMAYLANTLSQSGLSTKLLHIDRICWNGKEFVDQESQVIKALIKLYPWEWMIEEVFSRVLQANTQVIEPAWKMILTNKGLLVLLWELFPGHPNLLPTYFNYQHMAGDYVKKPLSGVEGENISLHNIRDTMDSDSHHNHQAFVYQQAHFLPNFDGNYPVIGSWLIAGESAGISIREDDSLITSVASRAVPHFFD
jgi:glutathionylspermidine synthase